jgi:hypothetical protein
MLKLDAVRLLLSVSGRRLLRRLFIELYTSSASPHSASRRSAQDQWARQLRNCRRKPDLVDRLAAGRLVRNLTTSRTPLGDAGA